MWCSICDVRWVIYFHFSAFHTFPMCKAVSINLLIWWSDTKTLINWTKLRGLSLEFKPPWTVKGGQEIVRCPWVSHSTPSPPRPREIYHHHYYVTWVCVYISVSLCASMRIYVFAYLFLKMEWEILYIFSIFYADLVYVYQGIQIFTLLVLCSRQFRKTYLTSIRLKITRELRQSGGFWAWTSNHPS